MTPGIWTISLIHPGSLAPVLKMRSLEDVITMTRAAKSGLRHQMPLSRRVLLLAAAALMAAGGILALGAPAASAATRPVPPGLGGRNWTVIPATPKVVALTFDAGANADGVASILATLTKYQVPATFFLTGNFVGEFPAAAKSIAAAGQRIGDHTVSHPYFLGDKLTDAQIRAQVLTAQAQIKQVTGADPWPWFRFPYGEYNQHVISVVNGTGFVPVGWTVDTLGWKGTSGGITAQIVVNRVLDGLRPGEIVLMHCGSHPKDHSTLDAAALPAVIQNLQARGYSFVTADALSGLGYHVLASNGAVTGFGIPAYGSAAGTLGGLRAVGLAVDPKTGGYWILKSNGGVANYNAPWYGSLTGKVPAGQSVTAIAGTPAGGYLLLTSNGGVSNFGTPWYGSDNGKLPAGVTATALAADPVTGGYWILRSNGGVANYNAPAYGSLAGPVPAGQAVTAIAAT
jgi:peptidoglycan/xylan/chitin deacetylase (PgdA/CDA1 family)